MEDKEKKLALQKAVGERVYHSRKLARMSKEELAERLGISSQYVNDIEQGNVKCCYRKLQEILLSAITGRKPYCLVAVCYLSFCLCSDVVR